MNNERMSQLVAVARNFVLCLGYDVEPIGRDWHVIEPSGDAQPEVYPTEHAAWLAAADIGLREALARPQVQHRPQFSSRWHESHREERLVSPGRGGLRGQ